MCFYRFQVFIHNTLSFEQINAVTAERKPLYIFIFIYTTRPPIRNKKKQEEKLWNNKVSNFIPRAMGKFPITCISIITLQCALLFSRCVYRGHNAYMCAAIYKSYRFLKWINTNSISHRIRFVPAQNIPVYTILENL